MRGCRVAHNAFSVANHSEFRGWFPPIDQPSHELPRLKNLKSQKMSPMKDNAEQRRLIRFAILSGALTIAVPLFWIGLSSLPGDAGWTFTTRGLTPVIVLMNLGGVVTLSLIIAAAIFSSESKGVTHPLPTPNAESA
jgi:hypothetical protein